MLSSAKMSLRREEEEEEEEEEEAVAVAVVVEEKVESRRGDVSHLFDRDVAPSTAARTADGHYDREAYDSEKKASADTDDS